MSGPGETAETTARVTLADGERLEGPTITLANEDGRLAGRIVDEAGRPAGDVLTTFRVSRRNQVGRSDFRGDQPLQVTGPDGRFAFTGLPLVHRYTVEAFRPDGGRATRADVEASRAPGTPEVTLSLVKPASLRVIVRDAEGRALPAALEVLEGGGSGEVVAWTSRSDPDPGRIDDLDPGRRTVVAHARVESGATPAGETRRVTAEVDLRPGVQHTLELDVK